MRDNRCFSFVLLILFLYLLCLPHFVDAQTTSPNHVNFSKSWLKSNPHIGSAYKGKHTLIDDPTKTDEKRPILSEEWWYKAPGEKRWASGSEPPEVETYELVARVTGQGVMHMSINGNTTHNYDVGSFRATDVAPVILTVEREISHYRTENFTVIRSYEDGYVSSYWDTCVRVKDKGFETEIKEGNEPLSATGSIGTSYINITRGTAKTLDKKFKASGGYPNIVSAEMGWGQTETSNWVWELEKDAGNTSTPSSISGQTCVVMLDPILKSPSTDAGICLPCVTCPNCKRSVNTTTDHVRKKLGSNNESVLVVCPASGDSKGCGEYIYDCTPEETKVQDAWHQERTCTIVLVWYLREPWDPRECGRKFRHCKNWDCIYRVGETKKGHSDGTQSQAPAGKLNLYADSHIITVPAADTQQYACGNHSGAASDASGHVWGTFTCGDATHVGYLCGASSDHSTTIYGYSGSFYECQPHTNGACGHTYRLHEASTHTLQASCSQTNAKGENCTVTSFYGCLSHTHTYPVAAGATCSNGHRYDSSNEWQVNRHRTRTCRYSECGQTWERCVSTAPICNKPWRKQNGFKCWAL